MSEHSGAGMVTIMFNGQHRVLQTGDTLSIRTEDGTYFELARIEIVAVQEARVHEDRARGGL